MAASRLLGAVAAMVVLVSCTGLSAASDAYWQDQRWDERLFYAVQSAVHYPLDAAGNPVGQPVSANAKVEFTYVGGRIVDPHMAQSTGRADLDAAMLQEISTARLPPAVGPHSAEPHAFALELHMVGPIETFDRTLLAAINSKKVYPREAIQNGDQGPVTVGFDDVDGKPSNVMIIKSSGASSLDAAAILAVSRAQFPPQPNWLATRPLHLRVTICYSLGSSAICPATRQVIEVVNAPGDSRASH